MVSDRLFVSSSHLFRSCSVITSSHPAGQQYWISSLPPGMGKPSQLLSECAIKCVSVFESESYHLSGPIPQGTYGQSFRPWGWLGSIPQGLWWKWKSPGTMASQFIPLWQSLLGEQMQRGSSVGLWPPNSQQCPVSVVVKKILLQINSDIDYMPGWLVTVCLCLHLIFSGAVQCSPHLILLVNKHGSLLSQEWVSLLIYYLSVLLNVCLHST